MKLIRIGDLITISNEKNIKDLELPFYGINRNKEFMPTVANVNNVNRKGYKIIKKGRFVFSGMQTGRDRCIRIGLYEFDFDAIVSPAYTTFEVTSKEIIPEFLFMYFKSSEKDRYGAFLSDGSIRSNLDWDVFCNMKIPVPSIEIQNKYVAIYKAMQDNLKVYQNKLDDLKLTKEYLINNNKDKRKIGNLIEETSEKNTLGLYKEEKGVSINKEFIDTKAKSSDIKTQKVVNKNEFAFNSNTSRNSDTISIAYNEDKTYIVSNTYVTFKCKESELNPKYLFLWFTQKKFDRYARFNSWGSARETISLNEIKDYKISIPSMDVQNSIVAIYESYKKREKILNDITNSIRNICPILVKGAIQEGEKGKNE